MPKRMTDKNLSEWGQIFKLLCDLLEVDQKWVVEHTGIKQSTLSEALSKRRKAISFDIVDKTYKAFESHPKWPEIVEHWEDMRAHPEKYQEVTNQ